MNLTYAAVKPQVSKSRDAEVHLAEAAQVVAYADRVGNEKERVNAGLLLERAAILFAISLLLGEPKHIDAIIRLNKRLDELKAVAS